MKELIQKLVAVPGPSGYEGKIRNFIKSKIESGILIDSKIFVGLYMSKALGVGLIQ